MYGLAFGSFMSWGFGFLDTTFSRTVVVLTAKSMDISLPIVLCLQNMNGNFFNFRFAGVSLTKTLVVRA